MPQEKRYSEDQPRDENGKFGSAVHEGHHEILTKAGYSATGKKGQYKDAEGNRVHVGKTGTFTYMSSTYQMKVGKTANDLTDAVKRSLSPNDAEKVWKFNLKDFKGVEERFMNHEIRSVSELRAEQKDGQMILTGYASLFNSPSKDLGGFVETVAPGAFKRSVEAKADVKCLFNHDPNVILGRVQNGTLTLEEDSRGLKFTVRLDPNRASHREVYSAVERKDINECSFAFNAPESGQEWSDVTDERGRYVRSARKLTDVDLYDISAVTYPAYTTTSVVARSVEMRAANKLGTTPAVEKRDEDSYEDQIHEVQAALATKFPAEDGSEFSSYGRFWTCETYEDYLIVQESKSSDYFRIPYMEDGEDNFKFGTPVPVEKEWVPSERVQKFSKELRDAHAELLARIAAAHKDAADAHAGAAADHTAQAEAHQKAHEETQRAADQAAACTRSMGNHDDAECRCQNRMVNPDEVFYDDAELDDLDNEDDGIRTAKKAKRAAYWTTEERKMELRDGKIRTKTVDGKNLAKRSFAHAGDAEKTETWKMPTHDAAHVNNAMRSEVIAAVPEDKRQAAQRKIKAAVKRLGMATDESRAFCEAQPMDEGEIEDMRLRFELAMRSTVSYVPGV